MPTRCRWPPDIAEGYRSAQRAAGPSSTAASARATRSHRSPFGTPSMTSGSATNSPTRM
jgi:hypothetical protein